MKKVQVIEEVGALRDLGLDVRIFGGWAKELLVGAWPYGPHEDLDLLVTGASMEDIETTIRNRGGQGIQEKAHFHKRAYRVDGFVVELFQVAAGPDGPFTHFFGSYRHSWTEPLSYPFKPDLRFGEVVTDVNILMYERAHFHVERALYATRPDFRQEIESMYGDISFPYSKYFIELLEKKKTSFGRFGS